MTHRSSESGVALTYILIGVALFAALSYTVAQMMRDGNPQTISSEKAKLYAAEILDYARQSKDAVRYVRISNSCSDTAVSFANNVVAGYAHTPAAQDACRIFHNAGGGISYVPPSGKWLDSAGEWVFGYQDEIEGVGTTCGADSCADLVMLLSPVKKQICLAINDALGIDNSGGNAPEDTAVSGGKFTGSYNYLTTIGDEAASASLNGKAAGCFMESGNSHFFYQVLIAR